MRARRVALALALLWGAMCPAANATTLLFDYGGAVLSCPVTGIPPCGDLLFVGDLIDGTLEADASHLDGGPGKISYTDFTSFSIAVGNFFVVDSNNSSLVTGGIDVDSGGNVLSGLLIIEANAIVGAPTTRITMSIGASFWAASVDIDGDFVNIANGVGKMAFVPVPGALVLFATALLGLLGVRRIG